MKFSVYICHIEQKYQWEKITAEDIYKEPDMLSSLQYRNQILEHRHRSHKKKLAVFQQDKLQANKLTWSEHKHLWSLSNPVSQVPLNSLGKKNIFFPWMESLWLVASSMGWEVVTVVRGLSMWRLFWQWKSPDEASCQITDKRWPSSRTVALLWKRRYILKSSITFCINKLFRSWLVYRSWLK